MKQLVELEIQPGIYTEQTDRGATNRWRDCDHVRFRYGLPEKIKGWIRYNNLTVVPPVRAEHDWSSLDNQQWLALASPQKLYLINDDVLYDITPIAAEGSLINPISTTSGSNIVTISHLDHNVTEGQYLIFSGAATVGGISINGQQIVNSIVDINTYTIQVGANATSTAAGGGTVNYQYEIAPPIGTSARFGWGIGPYGLDDDVQYDGDGWGTARLATGLRPELSLWSLDNWGEDLMACRRGGPIYVWERSNGPTVRARIIPNAPPQNNWILVSPEDRILIAYGSHDGNARDQSLIRWSAQEDYDTWIPAEGNSAGDKRIDSGSRILTAVRTRNETIIWTDNSIYSQISSGDNDVFIFQPRGESLSIVGPNAAVEAGGVIYFMARDEFMRYDGTAQVVPCTVRSFVFDNINTEQIEKTYASINKEESEIWWFYPDSTSQENNRYVVYNYRENSWYYGSIERTAYADSSFIGVPVAVDPDGLIYKHETGYSDNGLPLPSFVESYSLEIGNIGDFFGHVDRFIPDFLDLQGEADVTFEARQYPRGSAIVKGPYTITQDTRKVDFRVRGRQIGIKIAEDGAAAPDQTTDDTFWRFGTFRINAQADGKR